MPWRQTKDALKKGLRQDGVLEAQILVQGTEIQPGLNAWKLEQTFDLRCECKAAVILCVVQRLNTERVPCQKKGLSLVIPYGKGKHSPQPAEELSAVFLIAMQQALCIGCRAKLMSLFCQFAAQLQMVVDFAVENDSDAAIIAAHRLPAVCRVNDA